MPCKATQKVIMLTPLLFTLFCILSADPITKSDLQELDRLIDGDIEFPDEWRECLVSDKMTFTSYNCPYKNSSAIILVENTNDVSITIEYITNYDTDFRIKSGGNSFGGYSKCDECININLERMKNIQYKLGSEIDNNLIDNNIYGVIETGVSMKDLVESFSTNQYGNIRIIHAPGPYVAAGGYYQAGSHHETVEKYGYASDYIVGIEIVLYDGTIKTLFDKDGIDDCKRDLLWAIRGSGGGSFGVITKYYIKTIPLESADEILIFGIKYKFVSAESGKNILKSYQNFVQIVGDSYHSSAHIEVGTPSEDQPFGYFILIEGKYYGNDINGANESIYNLLLNDNDNIMYATDIDIKYPPNNYNVTNFAGYGSGEQLPGIMNTRLIYSFDHNDGVLTDEFYDNLINYYIDNYFVDPTKCICGVEGSNCTQCDPQINDLLTCCGVGSTMLLQYNGDSVFNLDPNNCLTSAPNRNYHGKITITTGTVDVSLFPLMKDYVLTPLLNTAVNDVLSYLGDQNFIGYRDGVDMSLDSYFGGKNNQKILKKLSKIKCKYDPKDVFHHPLSIPPQKSNCNHHKRRRDHMP